MPSPAARGLIFEVANYDITDEFGRHMAYQQEEVLGRTVTLTIDAERRATALRRAITAQASARPEALIVVQPASNPQSAPGE